MHMAGSALHMAGWHVEAGRRARLAMRAAVQGQRSLTCGDVQLGRPSEGGVGWGRAAGRDVQLGRPSLQPGGGRAVWAMAAAARGGEW